MFESFQLTTALVTWQLQLLKLLCSAVTVVRPLVPCARLPPAKSASHSGGDGGRPRTAERRTPSRARRTAGAIGELSHPLAIWLRPYVTGGRWGGGAVALPRGCGASPRMGWRYCGIRACTSGFILSRRGGGGRRRTYARRRPAEKGNRSIRSIPSQWPIHWKGQDMGFARRRPLPPRCSPRPQSIHPSLSPVSSCLHFSRSGKKKKSRG